MARSFTSSDYIDIDHNADQFGMSAITWCSWVQKTGAIGSNGGYFWGKPFTSSQGTWTIDWGGDFTDRLRLRIRTTIDGGVTGNGDTVLSSDTWYHALGRYDGSELETFLNGVSDATPASGSGDIVTTSPSAEKDLFIGSFNGTRYLTGDVCECAMWNRALSDEEIAMVYRHGVLSVPDSLVVYIPVNGNSTPELEVINNRGEVVHNNTPGKVAHPPRLGVIGGRAADFQICVQGAAGAQTITGVAIASVSSVGTASIASEQRITGVAIASISSVGTASIASEQRITGVSVASVSSVGIATIEQRITGVSIASVSSVGTASIASEQRITGVSIASASSVGTASIASEQRITGVSIASVSSVGTAAIASEQRITGVPIASVSSVGTADLSFGLSIEVVSIASVSSVGTASIASEQRITGVAIPSVSSVGTAELTLGLLIDVVEIPSVSVVGVSFVVSVLRIFGVAIVSASSVGTAVVGFVVFGRVDEKTVTCNPVDGNTLTCNPVDAGTI